MTSPETENKPSWKERNPFAFGITCGALIGVAVVGAAVGTYVATSPHSTPAVRAVEDKRIDLLRPLMTNSAPANPPAATEPNPADIQAECERFVSDLQALSTKARIHADTLRDAATAAYLASRSSEIDMDALTAKANDLKQDLADFQQAYPRIDPLISSLTPDQINQVGDIKTQFDKYQRLSERFDNTLVGIDDYRNRLAGSETYASVNSVAPQDANSQPDANNDSASTAVVSSTTTQTTTTVTSQPGSVYTAPVYYNTDYYYTPSVSLWFGYSSYDPFWSTSYCYPYWGYKNRYYPPPPPPHHPPGPPHNGNGPRPPGPPPGKPFPGNNPPPWTQPSNPAKPRPDNPLQRPPFTRPEPGSSSQPKPSSPRTTVTIPTDDNNRPNPRNLPWQQNPARPQNQPATTSQIVPANNNSPAYVAPKPYGNATSPSSAPSNKPAPDSLRQTWQQQRSTPNNNPRPAYTAPSNNNNSNSNNNRPSPSYTPPSRPDPAPSRSYSPPPSRPEPAPRQEPPSRPTFQPSNPPSQPSNSNSGNPGGGGGGKHR